jgi:AhpD family alkylhydroperoxidase
MARIDIPDGPGGDAAMVWSLRPEMAGMVDRMIATPYQRSILPAAEREVARMRIAQLNACDACATFRAPSVAAAGVSDEMYEHVTDWRTWPGYSDRQRLAIEYAERFAGDHRSLDDEMFARAVRRRRDSRPHVVLRRLRRPRPHARSPADHRGLRPRRLIPPQIANLRD